MDDIQPDDTPRRCPTRRSTHSKPRQARKVSHQSTEPLKAYDDTVNDLHDTLSIIPSITTTMRSLLPPSHPATTDILTIEQMVKRARELTHTLNRIAPITSLQPNDRTHPPQIGNGVHEGESDPPLPNYITMPPLYESGMLDFSAFASDVNPLFHMITGGYVQFQMIVQDGIVPIQAHSEVMRELLTRLIINARDAILPNRGRITLYARSVYIARSEALSPGWYACIEVSDTGHGIHQSLQEIVFQDRVTTRHPSAGVGYGLSICRRIVAHLGGQLSITSTVNVGTTLTVLIPAFAPKIPPYVLVGFHQAGRRQMIGRLAAACGYQVLAAVDGSHLLRLAVEHISHLRLIVTDPILKPSDGQKITHAMKMIQSPSRLLFLTPTNFDPHFFEDDVRDKITLLPWDTPKEILKETIKRLTEEEATEHRPSPTASHP